MSVPEYIRSSQRIEYEEVTRKLDEIGKAQDATLTRMFIASLVAIVLCTTAFTEIAITEQIPLILLLTGLGFTALAFYFYNKIDQLSDTADIYIKRLKNQAFELEVQTAEQIYDMRQKNGRK